MAIHESQSRFYENIIGRSKAFCNYLYKEAKKEFHNQFNHVTKEDFYKIINKVEPSLIRTEADELTYSLHVIIRYEIEKLLRMTKFTDEGARRFAKKLRRMGVDEDLQKMGIQEGDTVRILDFEFEYKE